MPKTPERARSELVAEQLQLTESTAPTEEGEFRLVGGELFARDSSGSFNLRSGGGVSDEYQSDEDATTRSTTTTGLDLAHRFTTSALAGGTYRIAWYYTWSYDRAANDFKGQVSVDGTVVGYQQQEPADPGSNQRNVTSGFAEIVLTSGAKDIDLEYGTTLGSATATIYISRLEIVRMS